MSEFSPPIKIDNRDPRVACAFLLDTSWSMSGEPIAQLNQGYKTFCSEVNEDPLARKRTEVTVITFGNTAEVAVPFQEGRDLQPVEFSPSGATPLGAALDLGLDQLEARKQSYKEAGLEYFRPWLIVITDGAPTDPEHYAAAARRVREAEGRKGVVVFAIGVNEADMDVLAQLSDARKPAKLAGLRFRELFQWLSSSMGAVSRSVPGTSDDEVARAEDEMTPLPTPESWMHL
jgi:uncharacterized protein YegL